MPRLEEAYDGTTRGRGEGCGQAGILRPCDMRFPSVEVLVDQAWSTLRRFPLTLVSAAAVTTLMCVVIDSPGPDALLVRAILASGLGVPLLFAIDVFAEREGRQRTRYPLWGIALVVMLSFYFVSRGWGATTLASRFVQLMVAAHLLVAFLPFSRTPEDQGFWQFNRTLFLRFGLATVFAGVLFAGLAVALASLDALFGVEVDGDYYARLFFLHAFLLHPWIFLAGVPLDVPALERETEYPKGLKIFAQFVLIPLVTVYLLILTAYMIRVVVTQEWPSGWIGWLVSSVSAVGILALLLVHPVRDREENLWVNGYARWFWVALAPSIVMLFFAIGKRIGQYGFTENRYFLLVLAIWIAGVAVHFAITRSRQIRWIPVSLCLLATITFLGPWGAYSVAERSQVNRLAALLEANGIGDLSVAEDAVVGATFEDAREISAVLRYLFETRGHDPVAQLLGEDAIRDHPDDPAARGYVEDHGRFAEEDVQYATSYLGVQYVNRWQGTETYVYVQTEPPIWPAPDGFTYTMRVTAVPPNGPVRTVEGRDLRWVFAGGTTLRLELDDSPELEIDLVGLTPSLEEAATPPSNMRLPPEQMVFDAESDQVRVRLHLHSFGGRVFPDSLALNNVEGDVFIQFLDLIRP